MLAGAASLTCGEAYGMRVAGRRLALRAPAAGIGRTIFLLKRQMRSYGSIPGLPVCIVEHFELSSYFLNIYLQSINVVSNMLFST